MGWKESYQDLQRQARQADAAYLAAKRQAENDRTLSDIGQRQRIEAAEAAYASTVADLQRRARPLLERAAAQVAERQKAAGGKELARLRETLGDTLAADIVRRKLELLPAAHAAQWAQEASSWGDSWAAAVVCEYADLELERRAATGDSAAEAARLGLPSTADPEAAALAAEARELRDVGRMVGQLDARQDRVNTAARVGVDAGFMAQAMYSQS